jgi:hypothetical protein
MKDSVCTVQQHFYAWSQDVRADNGRVELKIKLDARLSSRARSQRARRGMTSILYGTPGRTARTACRHDRSLAASKVAVEENGAPDMARMTAVQDSAVDTYVLYEALYSRC